MHYNCKACGQSKEKEYQAAFINELVGLLKSKIVEQGKCEKAFVTVLGDPAERAV